MVAARKHIGMRLSICKTTVPKVFKHRCRFCFVSAVVRGGFHLGSIYLNSSIGVTAKKNMDILDAVASSVKAVGKMDPRRRFQLHAGAADGDGVVAHDRRRYHGNQVAHVLR